MKVVLDEADEKALRNKIIEALGEHQKQGYHIGGRNPIETALRNAMDDKLKAVMKKLVNDPEFEEELHELGKELLLKTIKEKGRGIW